MVRQAKKDTGSEGGNAEESKDDAGEEGEERNGVVLAGSSEEISEPLTIFATCDNEMKLYADGVLVSADSDWTKTKTVTLPKTPRVLAVECYDHGVVGGILLSASNSLVTDKTWRCSNTLKNADKPGFNELDWTPAHEIATNGASPQPWGKIQNIADNAFWIWDTKDTVQTKSSNYTVYCRKELQ